MRRRRAAGGRGLPARSRAPGGAARAVAAAVLAAACAAAPVRAAVVDAVAALVNGEVITLLELEKAGRPLLAERLRAAPPGEQDRLRREVLAPLLEQLVQRKLEEQRARELGIQVSEQEVDAAVATVRDENRLTPQMLEQALAERGKTLPEYRREISDQIRLGKLVQREVRSRVAVGEEEVLQFYREHEKDYFVPERVRVRHLVIPVDRAAPEGEVEAARAKARAVLEEHRAGADFPSLVRKYSPQLAPGEGDPVSAALARGELAPELEEAAFSQPLGEVGEPLRTAAGFHLLQVVERTRSYQRTLDEVRESIQERLAEQKTRSLYETWATQLRRKALVEIRY